MKNIIVEALVLLVLLLCLSFLFQGTRAIWQPDEGYYVGTAVTMLAKNSISIPYLGEDEIFLDKPPLIYWGIIGGIKLFGHNEFAVRFFHGLSFSLTAVMVGLLAHSIFGNVKIAFLSSLIYATMVVPFIAANFVTPDALLTLWTTTAAFSFWQSESQRLKILFSGSFFYVYLSAWDFFPKDLLLLFPAAGCSFSCC